VEQVATVPRALAEEFLAVYRDAFDPLAVLAPARQALTDAEFLEELEDPSVVKFVARDAADEVVALATMATDLTTVPWISVPFYAARFPSHFERGAIFYFLCLLVRPDRQRGPWGAVLLRALGRFLADRQAVAVFDCCGHNTNVDGIHLPELIVRAQRGIVRLHAEELDQQRYFAFTYEGHR
jgi:hypothetical protein